MRAKQHVFINDRGIHDLVWMVDLVKSESEGQGRQESDNRKAGSRGFQDIFEATAVFL